MAAVLLRAGVWVSEPIFDWSFISPLGEYTPQEIEAWVAAGIQYMKLYREEKMARRIAKRNDLV